MIVFYCLCVMDIGQMIKNRLRAEGISQEKAAKEIGISRPAFNEQLRRQYVSTESIYRLSLFLEVNLFTEIAEEYEKLHANNTVTQEQILEFIALGKKIENSLKQ
jgi:transcriptional regulator with XRE-family HTH domain